MVRGRHAVVLALVVGLVGVVGPWGPLGGPEQVGAASAGPLGLSIEGGQGAAASFEGWLGREVGVVNGYLSRRTWGQLTASVAPVARRWAGSAHTLAVAVPLLPQDGATLAEGAAGRYDAVFRHVGATLVREGQADAIVRLGWEADGDWYAWSGWQDPAAFVAYWRRVARILRTTPGARFRLDWGTANEGRDPTALYPGDDVVDLIGLDVYDQSFDRRLADPERRWADLVDRPGGLAWLARFASARGKPISLPEWGLSTRHVDGVDPDDPRFVEGIHDFVRRHDVAYASYFEHDTHEGTFSLRSGRFPRAAARFRELFGPRPPAPTPPSGQPGTTIGPGLPTAPAPIALYTFDEGAGRKVPDRAGRLDLVIDDPGAVRWHPGALELVAPTAITSTRPAAALRERLVATGALSVEAWITPADGPQSGPARIATVSAATEARNLALGQGRWGDRPSDVFDLRLRTDRTSADGGAALVTPPGTAGPRRTHLVLTRAPDGTTVAYVDGQAVARGEERGDLGAWDPSFRLVLGNEATGHRPWLGTYHRLAVYDRALTAAEVEALATAGPEVAT